MNEKIKEIQKIVNDDLSCCAHNFEHVMRVYNLSIFLAENEEIDMEVLKISALLHDIARRKEDNDKTGDIDHAILGAEMAENILKKMDYSQEKINSVKHCIITHRFRTGNKPKTKEAMILFDADKLDVLGAIGIARCYMFAGQQKQVIFSEIPINEYIKDNLFNGEINGRIKDNSKHASNIEFQIKLQYIPDKLYTSKAKKIGKERVQYMKIFFDQLEKEIKGKA
jgi:uncharacterized protein